MSSGKVIQQIPDISAIQDPNTRVVLDAIKDILLVRNGDKGTGDHAFLTKVELKNLIGTDNYNLLTADGNDRAVNQRGERLGVAQTIRDLQSQIGGSPLSVYLAETIGLIKKPKTGVMARIDTIDVQFAETNTQVAAIQTQQTTLTNDFAAQATLVNTIQSRIDDVNGDSTNVTIEQKFTTLVNQDDFLFAQYTVKIDLDGYVVGYGLMATDNGDGPSSLFLVRADTFAIGAPGLNAAIPFIVRTDSHTDVTGVPRPNGAVYIEAALFGDFVADTGNIGDLTVTTLKIDNEAVTVPVAVSTTGGLAISSTYLSVGSAAIDLGTDVASTLYIHAVIPAYPTGAGSNSQINVQITVDGVPSIEFGFSFSGSLGGSCSVAHAIQPASGAHTIGVEIKQTSGSTPYQTGVGSLYVSGTKR